MIKPLLEIRNTSVCAGSFALRDIDMTVWPGRYVVVIGPTGSGKTVFLETLAGLRRVKEGRIIMEGRDLKTLPPEDRFLGFACQDSLLFPFLNVRQNIVFSANVRKVSADQEIQSRLEELSDVMGIRHLWERFPYYLSGGEKQRVSLARALLLRPSLLLLDEPLSALDQKNRNQLQQLLVRVHYREKLTVIHVTHDLSEAFQMATDIIIFRDGRIVQSGTPDEVRTRPANSFVSDFLKP